MNSTYGNVKSAFIDPKKDVEIFYHYRPTLNSEDINYRKFKKIEDVNSVFTTVEIEDTAKNANGEPFPNAILPGIYNLSLPVNIFGRKGFYTVFIRPKEIYCTITDVGALGAYPDVRGIILDMNKIDNDSGKEILTESDTILHHCFQSLITHKLRSCFGNVNFFHLF